MVDKIVPGHIVKGSGYPPLPSLLGSERYVELFQHNAWFKGLVEGSIDAITVIEPRPNGKIIYANPAFEKIYGYKPDEVLNQPSQTIPEDQWQEVEDLRGRILAGEEIPPYDALRRRKDGSLINVHVSAFPLIDDEGAIIGICRTSRDITEHTQRVRAETLARVFSNFIGDALNNGLTAVDGRMQLAQALLGEVKSPNLDFALENMGRLVAGIRAYTNHSSLKQGQDSSDLADPAAAITPFVGAKNLKNYVDEAIEVPENCEIRFVQDEPGQLGLDALPPVAGNQQKVASAVNEVVINAVESKRKISPEEPLDVRISAKIIGRYLAVEVADNGNGIPQQDIDFVQMPFYKVPSTKDSGRFGLGTFVAQQCAKACGGDVKIESSPGIGTRTMILLPLAEEG
jgi:PAS domain S-box-containing protein